MRGTTRKWWTGHARLGLGIAATTALLNLCAGHSWTYALAGSGPVLLLGALTAVNLCRLRRRSPQEFERFRLAQQARLPRGRS